MPHDSPHNNSVTIWGRGSSVNVQKVLWAAEELGLSYDHIVVGGKFGGNDTPEYRAMNPNGLVPVLRDSDGSLHWESNSILRYLAARYGTEAATLWPADPARRSESDRWMDWALTMIGEPMRVLFWGLVRDPVQADLNAMSRAEEQAALYWTRLDEHLAAQAARGQDFIAGASLTMGDIPLGCYLRRWMAFPITRPALPDLEAWYGRLQQRPGYARHVMIPLE